MFKLDRKLKTLAISVLFALSANAADYISSHTYDFNGKKVIDGGVYYSIVNGKTGPYYVNKNVDKYSYKGNWRLATKNEVAAWDKDVTPTQHPPKGHGTVEEGEELYEAQCVMCHGDFGSGGGGYPSLSKGNAYKLHKSLKNQRYPDPEADGPQRVFGTYWPDASTMWWYIQSGMPHPNTKSLSDNQTYALTAYMLYINELRVDGEVAGDDFELNQDNFLKIEMPNKHGFEPVIDGPAGQENARKYFNNWKNFGTPKVKPSKRCMKNCQKKTAKVVRIPEGGGIKDFLPPISVVRDIPKKEGAFDPKAAYGDTCAACHSGFLSPGSADWAGYTGKGMDKVLANAISGTAGGMPAKGGNADLTDKQIKMIIDFMVSGK